MQELAGVVHFSQSALSRAVARLERHGLVCWALCEQDRRGVFVDSPARFVRRHRVTCTAPTYNQIQPHWESLASRLALVSTDKHRTRAGETFT